MKRFLVFAGEDYYPDGGWKDFRGSFDEMAAAKAFASSSGPWRSGWWAQIIDTVTGDYLELEVIDSSRERDWRTGESAEIPRKMSSGG